MTQAQEKTYTPGQYYAEGFKDSMTEQATVGYVKRLVNDNQGNIRSARKNGWNVILYDGKSVTVTSEKEHNKERISVHIGGGQKVFMELPVNP